MMNYILDGDRWFFQLYEHVYSDRCEINTTSSDAEPKTSIEIKLPKQQPKTMWPRLCSLKSTPITPETNRYILSDQLLDAPMTIDSSEQPFEITIKKLKTNYYETNETFTLTIYVKHVVHLDVKFSETNFTATFRSK